MFTPEAMGRGILFLLPWNNIISGFLVLLAMGLWLRRITWQSLDTGLNRWWLGLSLWIVFTTFTAYDRVVAATGLLNFLPFFVLSALVSQWAATAPKITQIAWWIVLSTLPVSLFGLLQVIINRPDWTFPRLFQSYVLTWGMSPDGRITSFFGHFNELALFLVLTLPLAAYFLCEGKKTARLAGGVALGLGLIALAFSGSRNAWALAGIGTIVWAIYYRFWVGVGAVAGLGAVLAAAVWLPIGVGLRVLFPPAFIHRLLSTFDAQQTDFFSTASRWQAWKIAVDLIAQHPFHGWGLRNFPIVAAVQGRDLAGLPHEHNVFLALAVGTGLPGLVVWAIGMGWVLYQPWGKAPLRFAFQLGLGLYWLSGLLDITFYEPRINLMVWIMVGVLVAQKNLQYRRLDQSLPLQN